LSEHENDTPETGAIRLTAIEARVLGCLIEKEATTPDAYPLTLNATTTACNQKTSRSPVMKLEPGRVGQALRELERKGLARHRFSSRAERYSHTAEKGLELTRAQLAVIALLMLRGAQTRNELLARSERLHRFEDADELDWTIERLMRKQPPMVTRLPRRAGQREDRFAHLLCGPVEADDPAPAGDPSAADGIDQGPSLTERVARLEERLAELESRLTGDDSREASE
jgi:hypothetical protein